MKIEGEISLLRSTIDPHWTGHAGFEKYRSRSEEIYQHVIDTGIEFRGYRFWPPFFCFYCGIGISASQWCFSRSCGACDSLLGMERNHRIGMRIFAGRVEIDPIGEDADSSIVKRTEERGGFLDPTKGEGERLAKTAQAIANIPVILPPKKIWRRPFPNPYPKPMPRNRPLPGVKITTK